MSRLSQALQLVPVLAALLACKTQSGKRDSLQDSLSASLPAGCEVRVSGLIDITCKGAAENESETIADIQSQMRAVCPRLPELEIDTINVTIAGGRLHRASHVAIAEDNCEISAQ